MKLDFFSYLPPEITINILSRLPVRTTFNCKCVRKSWRSLIETPEFDKSYKSIPSLVVFQGPTNSIPYKVYELEDELNLENSKNPCNVDFNFSLPEPKLIQSSANGLLLLSDLSMLFANLAICNPVTREYTNIPAPANRWLLTQHSLGFGVSKTTGQYKLVRVFCPSWSEGSDCHVYTLGTGSWRMIAPSMSLECRPQSLGVFLNGNIHWLAYGLKGSLWISCFDLETEHFSMFSPPHLGCKGRDSCRTLFASKDCLGLCDDSSDQLVIWLMNTYGDGESWTKQFVFAKTMPRSIMSKHLRVIKVFNNGDVMLKNYSRSSIICFSNETKTIHVTDLIETPSVYNAMAYDHRNSAVCYAPSFFRLKTFTTENVSSF